MTVYVVTKVGGNREDITPFRHRRPAARVKGGYSVLEVQNPTHVYFEQRG